MCSEIHRPLWGSDLSYPWCDTKNIIHYLLHYHTIENTKLSKFCRSCFFSTTHGFPSHRQCQGLTTTSGFLGWAWGQTYSDSGVDRYCRIKTQRNDQLVVVSSKILWWSLVLYQKNIASSWFRQFCFKRHRSYHTVSIFYFIWFIFRFPYIPWFLYLKALFSLNTVQYPSFYGPTWDGSPQPAPVWISCLKLLTPLPSPSTVYWDTRWDGWEDAKTEDQMMSNALNPRGILAISGERFDLFTRTMGSVLFLLYYVFVLCPIAL